VFDRFWLEAQACFRSGAELDRAEFFGVLVDPGAADAASAGEFCGVDQRSGYSVVGAVAEEFGDSCGDCFDGGGSELDHFDGSRFLGSCVPRPVPVVGVEV
jgi:hypothetical protein